MVLREYLIIFALGELLTIHLKKAFMEKEKKKLKVLTAFSIFHKSCVKTFLKQIVNHYFKDTYQYDPINKVVFKDAK